MQQDPSSDILCTQLTNFSATISIVFLHDHQSVDVEQGRPAYHLVVFHTPFDTKLKRR